MKNKESRKRWLGNLNRILLPLALLMIFWRLFALDFQPVVVKSNSLLNLSSICGLYSPYINLFSIALLSVLIFMIRRDLESDAPPLFILYWLAFPIIALHDNFSLIILMIVAVLSSWIIRHLKRINENEKDLTQAFIIGLFTAIAAYVDLSAAWLCFAALNGFFIVRSVHLKSFLAFLSGIVLFFIYIALYFFLTDSWQNIDIKQFDFLPGQFLLPTAILQNYTYYAAWAILLITAIVSGLNHLSEKKIKLRTYFLLYTAFIGYAVIALFFFNSGNASWWITSFMVFIGTPLYLLALENARSTFFTLLLALGPFIIEGTDIVKIYFFH